MAELLLLQGRMTRLFTALALAPLTFMTACLFPQDDRIIDPDPPARVNQRPRIVRENLRPSLEFDEVKNGRGCGPYEFSFYVEDEDVDDTLAVRIYIDFDPNLVVRDSQGNITDDFNRPITIDRQGGLSVIRPQPVVFAFNPSSDTDPLKVPGRHSIWAVLADGPIVAGQVKQIAEQLPDGGLPDRRYLDEVRWAVTTVASGDCL